MSDNQEHLPSPDATQPGNTETTPHPGQHGPQGPHALALSNPVVENAPCDAVPLKTGARIRIYTKDEEEFVCKITKIIRKPPARIWYIEEGAEPGAGSIGMDVSDIKTYEVLHLSDGDPRQAGEMADFRARMADHRLEERGRSMASQEALMQAFETQRARDVAAAAATRHEDFLRNQLRDEANEVRDRANREAYDARDRANREASIVASRESSEQFAAMMKRVDSNERSLLTCVKDTLGRDEAIVAGQTLLYQRDELREQQRVAREALAEERAQVALQRKEETDRQTAARREEQEDARHAKALHHQSVSEVERQASEARFRGTHIHAPRVLQHEKIVAQLKKEWIADPLVASSTLIKKAYILFKPSTALTPDLHKVWHHTVSLIERVENDVEKGVSWDDGARLSFVDLHLICSSGTVRDYESSFAVKYLSTYNLETEQTQRAGAYTEEISGKGMKAVCVYPKRMEGKFVYYLPSRVCYTAPEYPIVALPSLPSSPVELIGCDSSEAGSDDAVSEDDDLVLDSIIERSGVQVGPPLTGGGVTTRSQTARPPENVPSDDDIILPSVVPASVLHMVSVADVVVSTPSHVTASVPNAPISFVDVVRKPLVSAQANAAKSGQPDSIKPKSSGPRAKVLAKGKSANTALEGTARVSSAASPPASPLPAVKPQHPKGKAPSKGKPAVATATNTPIVVHAFPSMVSFNGIKVERSQLEALVGGNKLTDSLVDCFLALVCSAAPASVMRVSSADCDLFIRMALHFPVPAVRQAWADADLLLFPFCANDHWILFTMLRSDNGARRLTRWDSLPGIIPEGLGLRLSRWLSCAVRAPVTYELGATSPSRRQINGVDCGVWVAYNGLRAVASALCIKALITHMEGGESTSMRDFIASTITQGVFSFGHSSDPPADPGDSALAPPGPSSSHFSKRVPLLQGAPIIPEFRVDEPLPLSSASLPHPTLTAFHPASHLSTWMLVPDPPVLSGMTLPTKKRHVRAFKLFMISLRQDPSLQDMPISLAAVMSLDFWSSKMRWRPANRLNYSYSLESFFTRSDLYCQLHPFSLSESTIWSDNVRHWKKMATSSSKTEKLALSRTQMRALIRALKNPEARYLALLAWGTSGRPSNVHDLLRENITYAPAETAYSILWSRHKTSMSRGAFNTHTSFGPYTSAIDQWLSAKEPKDRLFTTPLVPLLKEIRLALQELNPKFDLRCLRRGALRTLAEAGTSVETLLLFSGHVSSRMLYQYLGAGLHMAKDRAAGMIASTHLW